jgi:hypothetical protein
MDSLFILSAKSLFDYMKRSEDKKSISSLLSLIVIEQIFDEMINFDKSLLKPDMNNSKSIDNFFLENFEKYFELKHERRTYLNILLSHNISIDNLSIDELRLLCMEAIYNDMKSFYPQNKQISSLSSVIIKQFFDQMLEISQKHEKNNFAAGRLITKYRNLKIMYSDNMFKNEKFIRHIDIIFCRMFETFSNVIFDLKERDIYLKMLVQKNISQSHLDNFTNEELILLYASLTNVQPIFNYHIDYHINY